MADVRYGPYPFGDKAACALARLDADRTATGKTRIVIHPPEGACIGPGMAMPDPEYEDEEGKRMSLIGVVHPWHEAYEKMLAERDAALDRIAELETALAIAEQERDDAEEALRLERMRSEECAV